MKNEKEIRKVLEEKEAYFWALSQHGEIFADHVAINWLRWVLED